MPFCLRRVEARFTMLHTVWLASSRESIDREAGAAVVQQICDLEPNGHKRACGSEGGRESGPSALWMR